MVGPRYQYNVIPACSSSWKPPHKISSTFMPLKLAPGVKVLRTRPRGSLGENCYICHNKYSAVTYWQLSSIDQLYVRQLYCVSVCYLYIFTTSLHILYLLFLLCYILLFNLNDEMGLSIISQRGKRNVKENKWYNQNHITNKWGKVLIIVDHVLYQ